MASDTWSDIQAIKGKQLSMREKMAKRKKEREGMLAAIKKPKLDVAQGVAAGSTVTQTPIHGSTPVLASIQNKPTIKEIGTVNLKSTEQSKQTEIAAVETVPHRTEYDIKTATKDVEKAALRCLHSGILLPLDVTTLTGVVSKEISKSVDPLVVENLLQKFFTQQLLQLTKVVSSVSKLTETAVEFVDLIKLKGVSDELHGLSTARIHKAEEKKDQKTEDATVIKQSKQSILPKETHSIESLLSMETAKEKENKKMNAEIMELLSKSTAKELLLVEKFRSVGGTQVQDFCQFSTEDECREKQNIKTKCPKLHFRKIIQSHTDENLGDCSFLNTCFHMDSCKYVHYEIDYPVGFKKMEKEKPVFSLTKQLGEIHTMVPPQWVCSDLRTFDMTVLGKCDVIMADPPWDIHMELPYGTMGDDEMRQLPLPLLQDEGYMFLWVTGRAMELGRECLQIWGYERVDELLWVKTNQLQRIIRTGRTGHWLNHGKEHCLVGVKGNPKNANRGLDCDVIVAEVRATSHKPDEIYGMIERLMPGSRKVELFGRMHNVQPNWITLGNQLDGIRLLEPDIVKRYRKRYPDGYKMTGSTK